MRNLFRTTGLLSLSIWAAFIIVGIINNRPVIIVISGLFFALTVYRRYKIRTTKAPDVQMWEAFSEENPDLKEYKYRRWVFDESSINNNIIEKIIQKKVTGESFSVEFFNANNQKIPEVGEYNVIVQGIYPICIVKTVDIIYSTWGEVDSELARIEGYSTAEKWRAAKKYKFQTICDRMEYEFNDDLELFFEVFEIVYTGEDFERAKKKIR